MPRRILVALDGSPLAETILATVEALARRLEAEIVLLHVVHVPQMGRVDPFVALDEIVAQESLRARVYLDGVARSMRAAGPTVRIAVAGGDAAPEIVRYAEREQVDLLALATHGRSGPSRWLYGSVADGVLHATTRPLLLLRPSESGVRAPDEARRIVVPLDGSQLAEVALPLAEEIARGLDVPLVLVRVVELAGLAFAADPFGGAYLDYGRVLEALREDAEEYLAGVAEALRHEGLAVETVVPVGPAPQAIAAYAREHPGSLVVLGSHGRTGWRGVALGSVARRVVLLAEGPVLVVRPPQHAA